jgi:hypothetical protein
LYVRQRLSASQISGVLGIPDRTVRDRLQRYGIQRRTKGGWRREDRKTLAPDDLWMLYIVAELTADDIGRKLGTSRTAVLRAAHYLGLPVRTGGTVALSGPAEIRLIDALYADPLVAAVLAEHRTGQVPAGSPIWQRFPEPVPLTRQLVEDLYWQCGVGLNHIELLTGQPAETVRGYMRRSGIAVRGPGGRSPFLRRWRAGMNHGPKP